MSKRLNLYIVIAVCLLIAVLWKYIGWESSTIVGMLSAILFAPFIQWNAEKKKREALQLQNVQEYDIVQCGYAEYDNEVVKMFLLQDKIVFVPLVSNLIHNTYCISFANIASISKFSTWHLCRAYGLKIVLQSGEIVKLTVFDNKTFYKQLLALRPQPA